MEGKIIFSELSYQITGLCFQIHRELGRFCRERQYADRMEDLLKQDKIDYKREKDIKVSNNASPIGNIPDFVIMGKIVVDFKAKKYITKEDYIQMQRYLICSNLKLGMIVNFWSPHLKPKRVINSKINNY